METNVFDEYSEKYDKWFLKNRNVLDSEVALLARFLFNPGKAISIGCGSGLFESILKKDYAITISEGIEPSEGMAEIARKRGINVQIGAAESYDYGENLYDTVIMNGTPSYIDDLLTSFKLAYKALKMGGQILVFDVPKESSYALLYNLGKHLGTWEHNFFTGAKPDNVYPIEFVQSANWRTTEEKVDLLKQAGFSDFVFAQTLTKHPVYSNLEKEEPVEGYDKGDYVGIKGIKK